MVSDTNINFLSSDYYPKTLIIFKVIFYNYINKMPIELKDMIHTLLLAITVHIEKIKDLEKLVEQHSRALLVLGSGYHKHKKAIQEIECRLEDQDIIEAEQDGMSLGSEDSFSSEEDSDDKEFIVDSDEDMSDKQNCCKRKHVD